MPMRVPRPLVRLAITCAALVLAITAGMVPTRANEDERRIWLEVLRSQPATAEPAPAPRQRPRRAARPAAPATAPRAEPAAAAAAEVPQDVPITHRVVVFGDSLATNLGEGLADVLSDKPNVVVETRAQGSSGLVRDDFHDWRAEIDHFLTGEDAFDIGVVLVGLNDRQDIAGPEGRLERLGPEWKDAYARRVDTILAKFRAAGVPLVWVGLPPMRSSRLSTDLLAINEIVRGRVTRGGGIWVDTWQGFVDDDNRYSDNGPTLEGQIARLRAGDGIHFTPAGGRKAAHFADVEIRRLLARDRPAPISAAAPVPAAGGLAAIGDLEALTVEEIIARLSALPEAPEDVAIEDAPPAIGPVVPLTETAAAGSTALVRAPPLADRATRLLNERVLADGVAPPAAPGRADDFTWPAAPVSR
ncbi:SGNH/GDSL hydrolase family protein [Salinarimonas rosea]|uniref:SGNH/GDSL hydrolase family protein n=1 Tax=Salinarimonas rosea TaxID=552063 RepID=UPI000409B765|nr:SGNH family hydrolase [Salinarimonas rosea]